MKEVDKFVIDTNVSMKNEQMILNIKSHALKRILAKEIAAKYKESANLFTEFKKGNDQFIIKKWAKRFNTTSSTSGTGLAQVKSNQTENASPNGVP